MSQYGYVKYEGVEHRVKIVGQTGGCYTIIPDWAPGGTLGVVGKQFVRLDKDNGIPKPEPSTPDRRRDPPLPRPGGDAA